MVHIILVLIIYDSVYTEILNCIKCRQTSRKNYARVLKTLKYKKWKKNTRNLVKKNSNHI